MAHICKCKSCGHEMDAPAPVTDLRVKDNDRDEISVTLDGKEIRAWSYSHQQEQFWKMQMAREFVEGWYQAETRAT